jgi:predicted dehydrogenase
METRNIHWGILGLGKIAHKFAQDLVKVEDAAITAVASRSMDKARVFGKEFNAANVYGSYDELMMDPDVDIIYIATPHSKHYELTMQCLHYGKAVLCEKPIAINARQAKEMVELAREKQLFLMEGLWTRFMTSTIKVLELIKSGAIGELLSVRADFGFKVNASPDSRLLDPNLGGGSLLDVGIYPLYLSLLLLGDMKSMQAIATINDRGIDLTCSILGNHGDGQKSLLESSFVSDTPTEAYIYGKEGHIQMKSRFHHCKSLEVTHYTTGFNKTYDLPYVGNGYTHEILEVHHCLKHNKTQSDLLPLSMSLKLMQHLDSIRSEIKVVYPTDK